MKQKANFIAALTFVVGVTGFQFYAKKVEADAHGGTPRQALVVTQDLGSGALLSEDNLGVVEVPADYLDPRRVLASEKPNLIGVAVEQKLRAGEGLVWSDLADGAAHKHLAALITPGRRAYNVRSETNPLGRLLRVADHVDVILETGGRTETLLEHVLVLAVGGQIEGEEAPVGSRMSGGEGVTLSVTTEQAKSLLAAEARGTLRLVLRNPEDQQEFGNVSVGRDDTNSRASHLVMDGRNREIDHVR